MPPRPPARDIDEVVERLGAIVTWAKNEESRLGYFAALYRKVTLEVRRRIADGFFEDAARMETLDVLFANRYLEAFESRRAGRATTGAWGFAFGATEEWWPIVLQHLLLGINAHINLDLGIAAVKTMPDGQLPALRQDFDRINSVLQELSGSVFEELGEVWPLLRVIKSRPGRIDAAILNFSMTRARDEAWRFASSLSAAPPPARPAAEQARDEDVVALARIVRHPGLLLGAATRVVRLGERSSVREVITILE